MQIIFNAFKHHDFRKDRRTRVKKLKKAKSGEKLLVNVLFLLTTVTGGLASLSNFPAFLLLILHT
jgi:hypothetical protein